MDDPTAVTDFYGRWAGLYDLIAARTPGIRRVRERTVDALSLSPGDTVVEMGCGTGANLAHLRERVGDSGRVVGVDLTPGMLALARRRVERTGWRNVHVLRGDATRPPVVAADAILGTFVVGMFDDPNATVQGWAAVVGSGGRIALLDAVPRERTGLLDGAFQLFVTLSTPPTWQLRYDERPSDSLGERVESAKRGLLARSDLLFDERLFRGFLRLRVGEIR